MEIAVITDQETEGACLNMPWIVHRDALAGRGIHIREFRGYDEAFDRRFDAMILHVWIHWENDEHFDHRRTMALLDAYSAYRADYSETVQIVVNHTDMSRELWTLPYWRLGDPILFRTPAYDREELQPFPAEDIWAFEKVWGEACFLSESEPRHAAGFIGSASGPAGYRKGVAAATAKVGIGICEDPRPLPRDVHDEMMADCRIVVCPQGWGEQSKRHWDAWLSGKPVLTDQSCDSVEMIPGLRLENGVHYLVYDSPEEIPDIVADWTRPSRLDELAVIAENGRRAALSYDSSGRIETLFRKAVGRQ